MEKSNPGSTRRGRRIVRNECATCPALWFRPRSVEEGGQTSGDETEIVPCWLERGLTKIESAALTAQWIALEVIATAADEVEDDIDRLVAQKAITIMCHVVRRWLDEPNGET
jgi:hypothetical protein